MLMVPVAKYMEKISRCPNKHARKRTVKKKKTINPSPPLSYPHTTLDQKGI